MQRQLVEALGDKTGKHVGQEHRVWEPLKQAHDMVPSVLAKILP